MHSLTVHVLFHGIHRFLRESFPRALSCSHTRSATAKSTKPSNSTTSTTARTTSSRLSSTRTTDTRRSRRCTGSWCTVIRGRRACLFRVGRSVWRVVSGCRVNVSTRRVTARVCLRLSFFLFVGQSGRASSLSYGRTPRQA